MVELDQSEPASSDEDGRLRTVHPSTCPCGQWTKIWAQTVHLMEGFGRWTKIIILRWTSGRIVDHGLSDSRTDSDAFCGYRNEASVVGGRTRTVHLVDGFGRRTIKNLKMWTEVGGWTDGRSVHGGLGYRIL